MTRSHSYGWRRWFDPLPWSIAATIGLAFGLPWARPLFAAVFPQLGRPLFQLEPLWSLLLAHLGLVCVSSGAATVVGVAAGIAVSCPSGTDFRGLVTVLATMGQACPPVAVLAIAVPLLGFGPIPAVVALFLYGLLPIVENTVAGLEQVSPAVEDAARGCGMTAGQALLKVRLPLAAPVILAGIRTSVTITVGMVAIASTVGARSLGLPIIIGLTSDNAAYVVQGGVLVALLAISLDLALARLIARCRPR